MKRKNNKIQNGFTMVETLVASTLFLIVLTITTSTFLLSLRTQRFLLASVNATENISYALEVMGREIRMGKEFFSPTADTLNFLLTKDGAEKAVVYRLNNYQIERSIGGGPFVALTSPDVRVMDLTFLPQGTARGDGKQARITVLLRIASYAGGKQLETNLETTLSSRQPES
ncbi:MAG TPA: prepilin-type N-terminal cleavage/methylation domain-containing protein [Candidatus Paceibacterota bacterium]|nr:prepilin-type N-terminal cleavage/methylation domain-containing protein [Candidatus Paceibacterota bacterium]HOL53986.1 prepilin-type N-terminal cleavage/methylation domain-containing protein [Candidatus Paceibacterota bacterium]HON22062.1 prepilin-type N-terminal cleavage/methylation domain-containing protein [Candidatus Paceibacterota bacterium]HOV88458.1 prepilin-type N-terminal cleavage/methylation domain-containing protein [Candidatus Paceibacterota bacterium]HPP17158.1 prepilin-type N-